MNDSVVTANEAGGRHLGHPILRTVSEDEEYIAFHNDHVEHDLNDGRDENEKTEAEAEGIEGTSTETTLNVAAVNEESGHIVGDEHHARCAHSDDEAGSIVVKVSNDMSEGKTDDEEAGESAAAEEIEEISKKKKTW